MKVLHPSAWPWQPFTMPDAFPVPLIRPTPLPLAGRIVVTGPVANLLSLGLGRVDMDLRWMWTWHRDGILRLFRSWTGREVFRLRLTPLDPVPGGRWEVQAVEIEADVDPGTAERTLRSVLDSVGHVQQVLVDVPPDRASALQRGWDGDKPWPPPTDEQALDIDRRLPLRVERLVLRDRAVPLPPGLLLTAARALDDLLLLEFSDGSLLWLHRAWRLSVDDTWVASDVGSVLLWPVAGWPTGSTVGAWRVRRTDGEMEAARDPAGQPLALDDVALDEPSGRPDTLLLLSLTALGDVPSSACSCD